MATNQLERQIKEMPERSQTGQDVINRAMISQCKQCGTTGTQGEMSYGADPGYGGQ